MEEAPGKSAYSILKAIEEKYNIRSSTLKLNARSLRRLGLIDFSKGKNAELTINGKVILSVIKNGEAENGK
ncbi:MAG: hypothetical protein OH338_05060 [Candidatus Parvarchaeota archaeon]|nr:hypothetical protein [Candidatus Parvarchaeum tengchongense]MCW1295306.1 hypothetical protein [Candidatus Parvarchaeum tengchongense]MCW1298887.1 hypothetical protein [Candidatus Parvarchaeum tengchongense]MCW1312767.1 hypothetical protein [Candidatus Parvarchaeum tengchongense]